MRIGIDVGGTFTDLVAMEEGDDAPVVFKTPTTPDDPSDGVLNGIEGLAKSIGLDTPALLEKAQVIIHGTTVATNTLVEKKGAKVGLITTEGFRDLLEIREGLKEDRYNLRMDQVEPLAPRYLRVGVTERVDSSGSVRRELDIDDLRRKIEYLKSEGVDSMAICFLFSFLNPDHEIEAEKIVREMLPDAYVSASHVILPQIKEFDRLSTTSLNAYVGPSLSNYLERLDTRISEAGSSTPLFVIQSNGGIAPIADSSEQAVRSILSGPAGGAAGAAHVARQLGEERVIALDMGGTSTEHNADRGRQSAYYRREVRVGLEDRSSHRGYTHARGRGRKHRARGRGRCAASRPHERRRRPRSGVLWSRRNAADGDRCRTCPGSA